MSDAVPLRAEDLAPGDRGAAAPGDLRATRVTGPDHPAFAPAWRALWREFGARGEMEGEAVIRARLAWDPAHPVAADAALAYDLLTLHRGDELVAVRDHTAVVRLGPGGRPAPGPVVVHLSHALVMPAHRGRGLAAWLRALPLQGARRCAAAAGAVGAPVVLAAEMEPLDPDDPATGVRLRSYERAGFRKLDPAEAPYLQPDFRPPEALAGETPRALPLQLVLRRVGREAEETMRPAEVAAVVAALHAVYALHVPAHAMAQVREAAAALAARTGPFRLLLPTS